MTATHSIISTYFGSITIVLKLPFTRAASTKGLQRYRGFEGEFPPGEGGRGGGGMVSVVGDIEFVGVGDRLPRGPRLMERLGKKYQEKATNIDSF